MAKQVDVLATTPVTMIAEGTVFEGTVHADGDVRVGGCIVGTISAKQRVVIAIGGSVDGGLSAANADVAGRVLGDLHVAGTLVLRSDARVEGAVETEHLVVEDGALFNGTCRTGHVQGAIQRASSPDRPLAETARSPAGSAFAPIVPPPVDRVPSEEEPVDPSVELPEEAPAVLPAEQVPLGAPVAPAPSGIEEEPTDAEAPFDAWAEVEEEEPIDSSAETSGEVPVAPPVVAAGGFSPAALPPAGHSVQGEASFRRRIQTSVAPEPVEADTETVAEAPVAEADTETVAEAPVAEADTETVAEAPVAEAVTETAADAPVAEADTEPAVEAPVVEAGEWTEPIHEEAEPVQPVAVAPPIVPEPAAFALGPAGAGEQADPPDPFPSPPASARTPERVPTVPTPRRWRLALGGLVVIVLAASGYLVSTQRTATEDPARPVAAPVDAAQDPDATTAPRDLEASALPMTDEMPEEDDADTVLREAALQERTAMQRSRQRVADRGDEPEVAALFRQADAGAATANRHFEAGDVEQAVRSFRSARDRYDQIGQVLAEKDRALAEAEEPAAEEPAAEEPAAEEPAAEEPAAEEPAAEEPLPATVPPALQSTVQRLTRLLAGHARREDAGGMQALFYRGWEPFFDAADDVRATASASDYQVSDTRATVNVRLALDYAAADGQRRQETRSHSWTLTFMGEAWVLTRVSPR